MVVELIDVPPEHTHTHTHPVCSLDTPERFACIKFSCLNLITRCQNSNSGQYRLTSGSKPSG